jgi:hypothetical protein
MFRRPPLRSTLASGVTRTLALSTLALIASITSSASGGGRAVTTVDALPRVSERLGKPIWVPHCRMWLVEWRPTPTLGAETTASEQAEAVIDGTCKEAFERYDAFLRSKGLPRLRSSPDVMPSISLLPANVLRDGKAERALNDLGRFAAVAPGCCYWGLYVDGIRHLFLRNDPLVEDSRGALHTNPRFVRTLTHEISHVLSARLGVWDMVGYDRQRDENLAEEFVAFMGMRFPADTSDEDLAFHGDLRGPQGADGTLAAAAVNMAGGATIPQQSVSASASPQH